MFLLCALLTVYMVVMAARAVMSWFPIRPGTPWASISMVLYEITEPVLAPVRRIIPPAGMFDLSFLVVFFLLVILRSIVCSL
ncbi:MAG TPA: YggT family protein [Acidimicrobiia bacterium]